MSIPSQEDIHKAKQLIFCLINVIIPQSTPLNLVMNMSLLKFERMLSILTLIKLPFTSNLWNAQCCDQRLYLGTDKYLIACYKYVIVHYGYRH